MKTVVRIRQEGKVKDVGRRAMATVPAAAEVVGGGWPMHRSEASVLFA